MPSRPVATAYLVTPSRERDPLTARAASSASCSGRPAAAQTLERTGRPARLAPGRHRRHLPPAPSQSRGYGIPEGRTRVDTGVAQTCSDLAPTSERLAEHPSARLTSAAGQQRGGRVHGLDPPTWRRARRAVDVAESSLDPVGMGREHPWGALDVQAQMAAGMPSEKTSGGSGSGRASPDA